VAIGWNCRLTIVDFRLKGVDGMIAAAVGTQQSKIGNSPAACH
jgi:hypothetical protein